jgi:hypothetical protein
VGQKLDEEAHGTFLVSANAQRHFSQPTLREHTYLSLGWTYVWLQCREANDGF